MPGNKRRSDYHKGVKSREDIKQLVAKSPSLSEQDWIALHKALGKKLTLDQQMIVDRISAHVKVWEDLTKSAIALTALRKKIKAVRKVVFRYREDIWHSYRLQELAEIVRPAREVEEYFFMKRFRIVAKDSSPLELLGWSMDALISTCSSVEQALKNPDVGSKEREPIIMLGAVLRSSFKEWGLPHRIGKDDNKRKPDGKESKFIEFYIELLKCIDCPWPFSSSALATAISRFNLG